jgi:hypothetical protein
MDVVREQQRSTRTLSYDTRKSRQLPSISAAAHPKRYTRKERINWTEYLIVNAPVVQGNITVELGLRPH